MAAPSTSTQFQPGEPDYSGLVADLRRQFAERRTRSYEWRMEQLAGIHRFLKECKEDILAATAADLGKPSLEAWGAEVAYLSGEIDLVRKHLKKWMAPEKAATPLVVQPGKSRIYKEPLGVVLIIAPWNYPVELALHPLVGAVAAGNCAVVKPSEVTAATSALLARRLPQYVDSECIKVVEGAVPETTALLRERFDHIFYTGNGTVGRIVMAAAARHLTPVTLELGGKSPCIVDSSAEIDISAKRIAWGKWYNAGQTCVAPDYVLVERAVHDQLLSALCKYVREFWGEDPQGSADYGRVVNRRHHRRLMAMLGSGETVIGGQADEDDRYIAPTILKNVTADSPVMQEEIFGPILPVLAVESVAEAVAFVNERPKPLALYLFSKEVRAHKRVLEETSSGCVTINHSWMHMMVPGLPFGGVGESGMGAYHGRATFDTFTHRKSVLKKATVMDPPILYPPYGPVKKAILEKLL